MKFIGIIPARYSSTRLPGKPLVAICGKPMIQWVYEKSLQAMAVVYVATDDERIAETVRSFGGKVVLTDVNHVNGSTRCLEAWQKIKEIEGDIFDAVINIQGDEPLLHPETLITLQNCFTDASVQFATLAMPITKIEDLQANSNVFLTLNQHLEALYFSRAVIPFVRDAPVQDWLQKGTFYKHVGLYAYTYPALQMFAEMPPSTLEKLENLEQLRWIESGGKIKVGITQHYSISVDTPEDLTRVRQIMASALA